jgi:D-alanine--poly(phosphoribitol) ligase subunit 1
MGYRIELGEIETAVLSLPEIAQACVLYNWGKKAITLFYEVKTPITPVILRQRLTEKISKYMLPTVYRQLDSMPRNPNGKIDRQALTLTLAENS